MKESGGQFLVMHVCIFIPFTVRSEPLPNSMQTCTACYIGDVFRLVCALTLRLL